LHYYFKKILQKSCLNKHFLSHLLLLTVLKDCLSLFQKTDVSVFSLYVDVHLLQLACHCESLLKQLCI